MSKADYLKECISDVSGKLGKIVPIDDFNRTFCIVCVNRDCSRSKSNGLKFETRVNNWQDKYFLNVKRADSQDPQYENIRVKRFLPPNQNVYTIQDPVPSLPDQTLPIIETPISESVPEPTPEPMSNTTPEAPTAPEVSPQTSESPVNTPFTQGMMLPGAEKKETVLEPGQVFVFDDD